MMKAVIILTISLLYLININAQGQYFDNTYGRVDRAEGFAYVAELEDGYLAVGTASVITWTEMWILKTNSSGDSIKSRIIGNTGQYNHGRDGMIINNNEYIISRNFKDSNETKYHYSLISIDSSLGSNWEYIYDNNNNDEIVKKIIPTKDNGYLLIGVSIKIQNQEAQFHIKKVDSAGNFLWAKDHGYAGSYENAYEAIELDDDGGFLIIGSRLHWNTNNDQDLYIVRTDSAGNYLWDKTYGGNYYDGGITVSIADEGGFFLGGWIRTAGNNQGGKAWIIKADSQGDIIWEKKYLEPNFNAGEIRRIMVLPDSSNIALALAKSSNNSKAHGWIFKFDNTGDILWSRTYNPNPAKHSYFWDMDTTSDGGFIMCGNTHPYTQDGWLLKVDEWGCDTAGCHQGDTTIGIVDIIKDEWQVNIYPNPNNGRFNISISSPAQEYQELEATIINISGQAVWQQNIYLTAGKHEEEIYLDIPTGIYFYSLRSGDRIIDAKRMIVQ